jgi:hypothetical protein
MKKAKVEFQCSIISNEGVTAFLRFIQEPLHGLGGMRGMVVHDQDLAADNEA